MSVQIQCKSRLNLKTEKEIERLENNRGGKEWAGPVFPHPLFRRIIWLDVCNLNFSLRYVNHECSDSVKSSLNQGLTDKLKG